MHNRGTAKPDQCDAVLMSPVIAKGWLEEDEDWSRPVVLQVRVSVSAEELATALYCDEFLSPADLAADGHVWGCAAVAVVQIGLDTIERQVAEIKAAEKQGTLAGPDWLATCRRRVTDVIGNTASQSPAALAEDAAARSSKRVETSRPQRAATR